MRNEQGIKQSGGEVKGQGILAWLVLAKDFLVYTACRFGDSDGTRLAAGLSYVSLLALVPLMAIGLAVLGGFPALAGAREQLLEAITYALPPDSADEVAIRLRSFLDNASGMTGPGVAGLVVTAVLLLSNIHGAINRIFRVRDSRSLALRLLVYWTILTGGPLLIGITISLTTDLSRLTQGLTGVPEESSHFAVNVVFPFMLKVLGLVLLYIITANRSVRWKHALAGATLAAVLLDLITWGFGLYLQFFPSYQAIYGALATIPIFLLWMYLLWVAVLLGAEVAAVLPEFRAMLTHRTRTEQFGQRLSLALSILDKLAEVSRSGRPHSLRRLKAGLKAAPADVEELVQQMHKGGFLAESGSRLLLSRDLSVATLRQLMTAVGLDPNPGQGWPERAQTLARQVDAQLSDLVDRPLKELLQEPEPQSSGAPEDKSRPRIVGGGN